MGLIYLAKLGIARLVRELAFYFRFQMMRFVESHSYTNLHVLSSKSARSQPRKGFVRVPMNPY